jgi:hypothetical protein
VSSKLGGKKEFTQRAQRVHREHREKKEGKKGELVALDRKNPPFAKGAKDGAPSRSFIG